MSRHCRSDAPAQDRPPFPITLFVADTGEVAETNATTASPMPAISLPILVSSGEALSDRGILGKSGIPYGMVQVRPGLAGTGAYRWDRLRQRETQQGC